MSRSRRRSRSRKTDPTGLLPVDKPAGCSSMDVVRRVRRAAGNVRTGHAGTLDPLATGLVICCLGQATRWVEQIMGLPKTYEAVVDLSAFTTTDDREGERTVVEHHHPAAAQLDQTLEQFHGSIEQRPPAYSALHVGGQRAYKLARRGEQVAIEPRTVQIHDIDILGYEYPLVSLRVCCGKGTYIRSLARDLGQALGTGGHLAELRRTAIGPFDLDQAVPLSRCE